MGKEKRDSDRRVFIITGTPGVGKSSVSKALASKIGAEVVSIGELVEREHLYTEWDNVRETFIADMEAVSRRISQIIDSVKGDLIIEGHYAVHVVPPEKVSLVFVLRKNPKDLREILEERGYNQRKVRENLAAEILDVCLFDAVSICGVEKVCEINTDSKSPSEIAKEILLVIEGKKGPRVGITDWLGMLEAEGKLDEYLKEF
ncbi:adenylate kinase family protein [Candidatus Bathyarchaeota archaeon]|nr:adenylate kinase family protein [Candidatus Bathyarchaeota archaeon]